MYCPDEVERILIAPEEIKIKVSELGKKLAEEYRGRNPVVICVLKGSIVFTADLIREMDIPLELACLTASSYSESTMSGEVRDVGYEGLKIRGRDVIVVEDIIDTAKTLSKLKSKLEEMQAASVKTVTLLDKPTRREVNYNADLTGFVIDDLFVVGYGLDFAQRWRNLPYIAVLKKSAYEIG